MSKIIPHILFLGLALQGCGGGSSDFEPTITPPTPTPSDPTFSLSISDAPVDNVLSVIACFGEIELKSSVSDNEKVFVIGDTEGTVSSNELCTDEQGEVIPNTRGIDLLSLSGMQSTELVDGIEINPGEYTQLRLTMDANSYATVDLDEDGFADDADIDGEADRVPVSVPSNELKLDGFTARTDDNINLTIEFDLRKGMTNPVGQNGYILKPRGVRLVDNATSGHIEGTVSESILINNLCTVAPVDLLDSVASVYLYDGTSLDVTQLADNGGLEGLEAITSVAVLFDGVDTYQYEIGFVSAGDYTLALSCDEDTDPEGDDDVNFISLQETTVNSQGEVTVVDFVE